MGVPDKIEGSRHIRWPAPVPLKAALFAKLFGVLGQRRSTRHALRQAVARVHASPAYARFSEASDKQSFEG